jgi:hypothetical protein
VALVFLPHAHEAVVRRFVDVALYAGDTPA